MYKKQLHHLWARLRALNPWYFAAVVAVSGVVCIVALRANNEHMVQLRTALYQADQHNGDVAGALQALQAYVVSHMNTDLSGDNSSVYPPIQLAGTYDRLIQAQGDTLQKQNSQIYTDAQAYCEKLDPVDFSGHNRVPCIEQYVQSHGVQVPPAIPDSLYKFDFVSPRWSPDLAGWSLLTTLLFLLLAALLAVSRWWLKRASR